MQETCRRCRARRALTRPLAASFLVGAGLAPVTTSGLQSTLALHGVAPEFSARTEPGDGSRLVPARPSTPPAAKQAASPVTLALAARSFSPAAPPFLIPPPPPVEVNRGVANHAATPLPSETVAGRVPTELAAETPPPVSNLTPMPVAMHGRPPPTSVALRLVDIAQVSDPNPGAFGVPQLHEPGLVPGALNLADKTAAMQVALPPPVRVSPEELALLQESAPAELTVRVGSEAVGKVAFRLSGSRTIDVQLSGLLDVLSDRFEPGEFVRLRSAIAADSYVPLDSFRAMGVTVRYDSVYDELRVTV